MRKKTTQQPATTQDLVEQQRQQANYADPAWDTAMYISARAYVARWFQCEIHHVGILGDGGTGEGIYQASSIVSKWADAVIAAAGAVVTQADIADEDAAMIRCMGPGAADIDDWIEAVHEQAAEIVAGAGKVILTIAHILMHTRDKRGDSILRGLEIDAILETAHWLDVQEEEE